MKTNFYLDTSVVVDAILGDTDLLTQWSKHDLFSSALLEVEVSRTIERTHAFSGDALPDFSRKIADWHKLQKRIYFLDLDTPVLQRACRPFFVPVRSLDSLHIASAEVIRDTLLKEVIFFTRDRQQARAAESRGLTLSPS